jgi:hypothetical protein
MPDERSSQSTKLLDLVERGIEEADQLGMMVVAVKLYEIYEHLCPPSLADDATD